MKLAVVSECPISPAEAARVLHDGWQDNPVAQLYVRLLTDLRMNSVWAALKAATKKTEASADEWDWLYVVDNISAAFAAAENRCGWDLMTKGERERWLMETSATVNHLRSLIAQAQSWGNDDADPGLFHPLQAPDAPFQRTLGQQPDSKEFTIDRALYSFGRHLDRVNPSRTVRKPKDENAPRAEFIERVTRRLHVLGLHLPDSAIADLCIVVQGDESITPSLVSRFRYRSNQLRIVR